MADDLLEQSSDQIALNEVATTGQFPILGSGLGPLGADAPEQFELLQEDGFFLLQEDGSRIIL